MSEIHAEYRSGVDRNCLEKITMMMYLISCHFLIMYGVASMDVCDDFNNAAKLIFKIKGAWSAR